LRAFHQLGIKPGVQVPVIGYDDVSIAEVVGLSTIKIPVREMVQALFEMVEKKEEGKIKFSPSLVLRETA
jgi:LacI family transcriptional regulator